MLSLYLRNLPRRPNNPDSYARLLLKHINIENQFVIDQNIEIPGVKISDSKFGSEDLVLLDDKFGIVTISKSMKLHNQCFITFKNQKCATIFKEIFTGKLKINGRNIDIEDAKCNSFVGIALQDRKILNKILKKKKIQKNDKLLNIIKQKRRVRRLKFKLKLKNISEIEIQKIVGQFISKVESTIKNDSSEKQKKKVIEIDGNPPNKVLLVQNLPQNITLEELSSVFHSEGFVEIRLVAVRQLAFVEYKSIENASKVINKLGKTQKLTENIITIGFAK